MAHAYILVFLFLVDPDFLKLFLLIHESCKAYGATPSRYMTFLRVYSSISSSKKKELLKRQSHLQVQYWQSCYFFLFIGDKDYANHNAMLPMAPT